VVETGLLFLVVAFLFPFSAHLHPGLYFPDVSAQ
jgi:hypothetical protein